MNVTGNTVLITGGASGIGLALAGAFCRARNTVIIVGRDQNKLAKAKEKYPELHILQTDITLKEQRCQLAGILQRKFPALNILINNAGLSFFADISEPAPELLDKATLEIETNYLAPLHLSLLLVPQLKSQDSAAIVNITTAGVYLPLAATPGYSASKAALSSFTRTLRQQLAHTKIKTFEVLPPAVDTEMVSDFKVKKLSPDNLAEKILSGLKKNQLEMPLGPARALKWLIRLAPGFFGRLIHRQMVDAIQQGQPRR